MIPLRDNVRSRRVPIVMGVLILVNVLVFAAELRLTPLEERLFFTRFALVPVNYLHGPLDKGAPGLLEYFVPFITHIFLHAGWLHIITNMWFLWIFGPGVEDRIGHGLFLVFYLGCGIAAAMLQLTFSKGITTPMVGASGAIAGVLGAYMLLYPTARVLVLLPVFVYPLFIHVPAVAFIVVWFALQLFGGTQSFLATTAAAGTAWWRTWADF